MSYYTRKQFELKENILLQPEHLSGTEIHKHIRKYIGFQHIRIDEKNRLSAFQAIWREFMKFTEECYSEVLTVAHRRKFQYMAVLDMPIALMPDGSQIICTNTIPQTPTKNGLFFVWIGQEGMRYV
ncbi:MAG: hypothetical protein A3B66_08555 [Alphaproteobacteria bacterium RIFCSPHIGHO2_02_FULL_46_13]|nr:MAG: hypothetical protein A3B66_08555 [Alphaproteobacteria bacterium RIFCSPHIGHO2_02_FULL_46_13]